MDKIKQRKNYYIWLCFAIIIWLSAAQVLNNSIMILLCIFAFAALLVYAAFNDMALPLLLFFLPWSPLIKTAPGKISMYSVMLICVLLILILRNRKNFAIVHIFPAALLFLQVMILKQVYGESLTNANILFFICLLLFPLLSAEKDKKYDFYSLTIYFALGIVTAALISQWLIIFPTIKRYITIDMANGYSRVSGFFGDPNYYAAHITAAIAGVILLLPREKKIVRRTFLIILISLLLYCGLLSVAKSFFLIVVSVFLLWFVEIIFARGKVSNKVTMIAALMILGAFLLSSTLFTDLMDQVIDRLVLSGGDIGKLTTGRVGLWNSYFSYFEEEPLVMIFGRGCTSELVQGRASHNILIQIIYQFGLFGFISVIAWISLYMKTILRSVNIRKIDLIPALIIAIGAVGPWMALDLCFFDEFFLIPFYMCLGMGYIAHKSEENTDYQDELNIEASYEKNTDR